jgi:hypothetical protein
MEAQVLPAVMRRLRQLEDENSKLRKVVADDRCGEVASGQGWC